MYLVLIITKLHHVKSYDKKTKEIFKKIPFWFKNFEWLKKHMVIGCNRHPVTNQSAGFGHVAR